MMKINSYFICIAILCSCNNPQTDKEAEGKKLMELSKEWSRLAEAGDTSEKMFDYLADDAIVMSPGQAAFKGKAAIREMVVGAAKVPGFNISWQPLSAYVSDDGKLAYMIEENQITVNDSSGNRIVEKNKAVTIWKKQAD